MKKNIFILIGCVYIFPTNLRANDSAASVGAGGIHFEKTKGLVMEKEDLFISKEKVKVSYVFKNITKKDITIDVFFPLPVQSDISAQDSWDKEILDDMTANTKRVNPQQDTAVFFERAPFNNFSVLVNDQKTPFQIETRALKMGKDITNVFKDNKLSISPVLATCEYAMDEHDEKRCSQNLKRYKELGLVSSDNKALWEKQVHYHWKQTFLKGQDTRIEHTYRPARGSFFLQPDPQKPLGENLVEQLVSRGDWMQRSCAWASVKNVNFVKWLAHEFSNIPTSVKSHTGHMIMFYEVAYILTTGANWDGPIRDFTLTVEYPKGGTFASCGVFDFAQTNDLGENRIQFHQKDFTPNRELKILFGEPLVSYQHPD